MSSMLVLKDFLAMPFKMVESCIHDGDCLTYLLDLVQTCRLIFAACYDDEDEVLLEVVKGSLQEARPLRDLK